MDHHFRALSFVDRITAFEPGVRVSGSDQIPAGIAEFPLSLVAEATGQFAAWSARAARANGPMTCQPKGNALGHRHQKDQSPERAAPTWCAPSGL